jgi:hypothetical protein
MKQRWSTSADLVKTFGYRVASGPDNLAILGAVWDRELGHLSKYWSLVGFKKGVLYVRPKSAAAAQELAMRAAEITRILNKHFNRSLVKAVKATSR